MRNPLRRRCLASAVVTCVKGGNNYDSVTSDSLLGRSTATGRYYNIISDVDRPYTPRPRPPLFVGAKVIRAKIRALRASGERRREDNLNLFHNNAAKNGTCAVRIRKGVKQILWEWGL